MINTPLGFHSWTYPVRVEIDRKVIANGYINVHPKDIDTLQRKGEGRWELIFTADVELIKLRTIATSIRPLSVNWNHVRGIPCCYVFNGHKTTRNLLSLRRVSSVS